VSAEFELSSSSFTATTLVKMSSSSSFSVKAVKVAAACTLIVDHLTASPEYGKCELEDFVIWGKKFLELKVRWKNYVIFFFY
jgi:hypothetical protein